jgi:DNA-binding transcriptional LysR family regulator
MAAGHDPVSGVVRVTAPEAGLATEWLPKALLPLRTLHPGLVVEIAVEHRVVEMSKREADIAIRNQRPTDGALTTRAVGTFAWYLYAAPEYLERRPATSELTDLMQHDILLYETPSDDRQSRWLSQRRLLGRAVLSSNSVDALARAARVGWGIALLPAFVADRDTGLRRVLLERPITKMPLWLVTHAQLKLSARVQAVFRRLARRFEETRERPH